MRKPQRFPVFEPEVLAAATRRSRGDVERIATTALGEVAIRNVRLSSRYRKAHELERMARVVEALPDHWLTLVRSVYCDSKISTYAIKVAPCRQADMRCLADLFSDLFVRHAGGHNGVHLSHGPHAGVLVNPKRA